MKAGPAPIPAAKPAVPQLPAFLTVTVLTPRQDVFVGQPLELHAVAGGPSYGEAGYTYQWFRSGERLPRHTGRILRIDPARQEDRGEYVVELTKAGMTATSQPFKVRIPDAPGAAGLAGGLGGAVAAAAMIAPAAAAAPAQGRDRAEAKLDIPAMSLLSRLRNVPEDRDQGRSSSDWVWAATAAIEMELRAAYGITDRLSIQYFNSAYRPRPEPEQDAPDACFQGSTAMLAATYNRLKKLVPWSNPNAHFQDGDLEVPAGADAAYTSRLFRETRYARTPVAEAPCYPLKHLEFARLQTSGPGVTEQDAIQAIKEQLNQKKVVVFNDSKRHVAIVGYGERGLEPHWILLESVGTRTGREDGTSELPMRDIRYLDTHGQTARNTFEVVSRLELDPHWAHHAHEAPKIEPARLEITMGRPMLLSAACTARPPLEYQWYHQGRLLAGETGSTLRRDPARRADAGQYQVDVVCQRDGYRQRSPVAEVVVAPSSITLEQQQDPLLVHIEPETAMLMDGEPLQLVAYVNSKEQLYYQWLIDDTAIPGANAEVLVREGVVPPGRYSVRVSTDQDTVLSSNTVQVAVLPRGFGAGRQEAVPAPREEKKR